MSTIIADFVTLLVGTLAFLCGLVFVFLPFSSILQENLISLIQEHRLLLFFFGIVLTTTGSALFSNFFRKWRRTYYRIQAAPMAVDVDLQLLKKQIEMYLAKQFPKDPFSVELSLFLSGFGRKKQGICLNIDLPYYPLEEQKSLSQHLSDEIQNILMLSLPTLPPLKQSISFATH